MNKLIFLEHTKIRQDSQGRYCLNDLHQASGGHPKHRPSIWLANLQTQELVQELSEAGNPASVGKLPVNTIKGGNATLQGTYVCKELVYAYAMWISPKFHLLVIRTFDQAAHQTPSTPLPQNYLEALEKLVETEKAKQALEYQRALDAPKVAFVEHYVDVGTSKSLRETAKILNFPEKRMIECLERDRVLYRQSGNLLPYQDKHAQQLFTVKTGTAEHGHNFTQTRVTAKGIEWIAQRYISELGL